MKLGWRIPLPGPLYIGGTLWRSKPRRTAHRGYHAYLGNWSCGHNHRRPGTAQACLERHRRTSQ